MSIITKEEFAKATKLDKFHLPALAAILMELMKINEVNTAFEKAKHLEGVAFIDKILDIIGITVEFDESELKNFPKEGAFIAIANHPYGGIEGLILLKIMCTVRPDSKLMANFLLKKIPNLSDYFIGVNPFENLEHSSSISGIKTTIKQLKSGTPVGIFPAGEVSTFKARTQHVSDRLWHPVVGKLISKADVPVIPVYFHGNNSLLFQILSLIHPALRTAKLPSELFNKKGHKIRLRIGKQITTSKLPFQQNNKRLLEYLRAKTYALGAGIEEEHRIFRPGKLFKIKKKPKDILPAIPVEMLEKDISKLRSFKVHSQNEYEVYISPSANIPNILKEIGRLREVTFREVGEGTNNETDLDKFDIYYYHLFIWDKSNKMIVGAYRIGKGEEIYESMGKRGFYLNELFKLKPQFYPILKQSLELGRSWIRKEYQQRPLPLFLLWKGILKFINNNPSYNYLIGPVSISNKFSKLSKSLIIDYIKTHHFDPELSEFVKPRKKFKVDFQKIDKDLLIEAEGSLKSLDNIISDIECSHMKIPVLLRQYLTLNAKILCFNTDPKFSDSLDGFLIADIRKIPDEMISKIE